MRRVTYLLLGLCLLVVLCGVGAQPLGWGGQRAVPSGDDSDGENAPADEQDGLGATAPLLTLSAPAPLRLDAPCWIRVSALAVPAWRAEPVRAPMRLLGSVTPLRC